MLFPRPWLDLRTPIAHSVSLKSDLECRFPEGLLIGRKGVDIVSLIRE